MEEYDVIVVGAGIAGSFAGMVAAEKGLKTLILEMGNVPGEKACFGLTGYNLVAYEDSYVKKVMEDVSEGLPLYAHYGVALHFVDASNVIQSSWYNTAPNGMVRVYFGDMSRKKFYSKLVDRAKNAGATVRTKALVVDVLKEEKVIKGVVVEGGEKIRAHIVIAADGANSLIARKAGLLEKWPEEEITLSYNALYKMSEKDMEDKFERKGHNFIGPTMAPGRTPPSKAWCYPSPTGIIVGLESNIKYVNKNLKKFLRNGLFQVKLVKNMMKPANGFPDKPAMETARVSPMHEHLFRMYADGLMVAGDAAGTCNPMSEEGIRPAATTGVFAAETAAEAISKGDCSKEALSVYQKKWEETTFVRKETPIGQLMAATAQPADKIVENVRLIGPPMHAVFAPRGGDFGGAVAWMVSIDFLKMLAMWFGPMAPTVLDPTIEAVFDKYRGPYSDILTEDVKKWIRKNIRSLMQKGVFAHPF